MLSRESILQMILEQKLSADKAATISDHVAAAILYVLSNESLYKPYLQELNDKMAGLVTTQEFYPVPTEYKNILAYHLPAPPAVSLENGEDLTEALEQVLLAHEQKHGFNMERTTKDIAVFVGLVPSEYADRMVAEGQLWNDDNTRFAFWLHGFYSHRVQLYSVRRYFEDHPEILDEIFHGEVPHNYLSYIVQPKTNVSFPSNRRYWHITLDNARDKNNLAFIKIEPNLTGPIAIIEQTMSEVAFVERPYLANAQYHSYCAPLFRASSAMQVTVAKAFDFYVSYQRKKSSHEIDRFTNDDAAKFLDNPSFMQLSVLSGIGGILYRHPLKLLMKPGSPLRTGFFSNTEKHNTELLNSLCKKYKVQPSPDMKSTLGKMLRIAAASAIYDDIVILVDKFKVDVNIVDTGDASSKRTAMHWLIIKAPSFPAHQEKFLRCAEFLVLRGIDFTILDASLKTAAEYDTQGLFKSLYLKDEQQPEIKRNKMTV